MIPNELIILSSKAKILHSFAKKKLIISKIGIQLNNNETSSQFLVPKPTVLNADEWKDLENEFGKEKLEFFFTPVSQLNGLFNMSMDEAMDISEKRQIEKEKILKND